MKILKKISIAVVRQQYLQALIILLVIILAIAFSIGKDVQQINRLGDAAIFEQIIENINSGKGAVSNVFASTQNFIDRGYTSLSLSALATMKLELSAAPERNVLGFHADYILYVLAPFVNFFSSSLVLTLAQSFCFFGLLLAAWVFVYKQTQSLSSSTIFLLFVLLSHNWVGGIDGQFYPDRIFVLAGFLLCCMAFQGISFWRLLVAAICVSLINERAALIGGVVLMAMPLYSRADKYERKLVWSGVSMGILLLAYAYFQKNYVLSNVYYGGYLPQSIGELVTRLSLNGFAENIGRFFLNNILLVCLSLAAPRLALLTLFVMLPNIVGNVGGAEKTGWLTHYHSYYFPILAFSAAVGFSNIYNKFFSKESALLIPYKHAVFIVVMVSILIAHHKFINDKSDMSPLRPIQASINNLTEWLHGRPTGYAIKKSVNAMFTQGSSVSTNEMGMSLLHSHVSVSYFPVGVENANYIFLPCPQISEISGEGDKSEFAKDWLSSKRFDSHSVVKVDAINYCRLSRL